MFTMNDHLKKIFSTLVYHQDRQAITDKDYRWFITRDQEVIGIHQRELSERDASLLAAFLEPYHSNLPFPTNKELWWKKRILQDGWDEQNELDHPFRFIFFSFSTNQIEPSSFKEAICALFETELPILWKNEWEGVIIEEASGTTEQLPYEQIIDILMDDLHGKIKFFVSPFLYNLRQASMHYDTLQKHADISFAHSNKGVISYFNAIPFIMVDQSASELKTYIETFILKEAAHDEDLILTVETFFECSLNISETAKKLYLHRNSLQYRLDRFTEKTGIDIRNFQHALIVYLALLCIRG